MKPNKFTLSLVLAFLFCGDSELSVAAVELTSMEPQAEPQIESETDSDDNKEPINLQVQIDRIDGSTLHFKWENADSESSPLPPAPLRTRLYEIEPIGRIAPEKGDPYFVIKARPCDGCLEEKAIFVVRHSGTVSRFVHPGKITHPQTKQTLMQSRAFYGKCLNKRKGEVYVSFQKDKVDRRRYLQSSVLVAEATENLLEEKLIVRRSPKISETLRFVKKDVCHEIKGFSRSVVRKPLDLTPKSKEQRIEPEAEPPAPESEDTPEALTEDQESKKEVPSSLEVTS